MIVVNLFGGPAAGKTTTALGVTHMLKAAGIDAEYVQEYARELVFDGVLEETPQSEILVEQRKRIERLAGKAAVVVSDSPLLMQKAYAEPELHADIEAAFGASHYLNMNYFIRNDRTGHHSMVGRAHDKEQAKALDLEIGELLRKEGVRYSEVPKGCAVLQITSEVFRKLKLVGQEREYTVKPQSVVKIK